MGCVWRGVIVSLSLETSVLNTLYRELIMSASFNGNAPPLTIPSGASVSNALDFASYSDAASIILYAPATLDALTFTIEGSRDGITFMTLYDGAADIAPPPAGKCRQYIEMIGLNFFRIKASGNVAADRTWSVTKTWTI